MNKTKKLITILLNIPLYYKTNHRNSLKVIIYQKYIKILMYPSKINDHES